MPDDDEKSKRARPHLAAYRWKKGFAPNPTGINQDPEIKKLKRLTTKELVELGSFLLDNNIYKLQEMAEEAIKNPDSEHSSLKIWIARIILKSSQKGDARALDTLLNRIVGKVPDRVKVEDDNSPQVIVYIPDNGRTKVVEPLPSSEEIPSDECENP